jgi:tetratricopeptide (TPR) repeat protein
MDAGDNLTALKALKSIDQTQLEASPEALEALGSCLTSLAKHREAIDVYKRCVELNPTALAGFVGLSNAYQAIGRRADSAAALDTALSALQSTDVGGLMKLSAVYSERFDTTQALQAATRALAAAPHDSGVVVSVAQLQYKLRNPVEARKLAIRALELAPQNALAHRLLGDLAVNNPSPGEGVAAAEDHYLRSLQSAPTDTKCLAALASLYLSQQRYRQAVYIALTWVAADPNSGPARMLLSKAYQGSGDTVGASSQQAIAQRLLAQQRTVEQLTTFRNQRPSDARVRVHLAQALRASGMWSAALQEAQAAACLQPDSAEARSELALICRAAGLPVPTPAHLKSPSNLAHALR